MAASCYGTFGLWKHQYSSYQNEGFSRPDSEMVWVTQRYNPLDERVRAPVPRHKLFVPRTTPLPESERYWIPKSTTSPTTFGNAHRSNFMFVSHPATRCEDYSTLRQMLPTYSNIVRVDQAKWGVSGSMTERQTARMPLRFPHVNGCFTKFIDEGNRIHQGFKLC
ncbi:unnamed protein product [Lymnaea stagnalis]|uniref:Uncharacterized protein n=1 Tax=Lymnaea stagnalis TaxID=6523 RepID=A0AAV2HIP8_LYMST